MQGTIDTTAAEETQQLKQLRTQVVGQTQRGELATALETATNALTRFISTGYRAGEATALALLGRTHLYLCKYRVAQDYYQQSLRLWEALDDKVGQAEVLKDLGVTLVRDSRDDEAMTYFQRGLSLSQHTGDRANEVGIRANMALIYKGLGDFATAQEMFYPCLAYYEETGHILNIAKMLLNIANTYTVLEDPVEAVRFAGRAVSLLGTTDNLYDLCLALMVAGTAHMKMGQTETGLLHFYRALPISEKVGIPWVTAVALGDIGDALTQLKRFVEARTALERALALTCPDSHADAYVESLERLALLYANQDYAEHCDATALRLLEQARAVVETTKTSILLVRVYTALTDLYERTGAHDKALECHRLMYQAEKRIFNETSDKRVKSLQIRFGVEQAQKDAEIAHLRSVELASALAEAEQLRRLATIQARTDALTGVPNRRGLDEQLADTFAQASQNNAPLSVALIDIDHFKKINDKFGHSVGDAVLRHVATLLLGNCRKGDHLSRYGGEEFCLLAPTTSRNDAVSLCERLRALIEAEGWARLHPDLSTVTVSIGIAVIGEHDWTSAADGVKAEATVTPALLIETADHYLYAAKQTGRNRVIAFGG